jgi:hypothetical protein
MVTSCGSPPKDAMFAEGRDLIEQPDVAGAAVRRVQTTELQESERSESVVERDEHDTGPGEGLAVVQG